MNCSMHSMHDIAYYKYMKKMADIYISFMFMFVTYAYMQHFMGRN